MDILRVLTTPDLEVRKKTLQLALDLVSSRNVEEVSDRAHPRFCWRSPVQAWPQRRRANIELSASVCFPAGDCSEEGGDQDQQRHRARRH